MRRLMLLALLLPTLAGADEKPTVFKVQVGHSKPLSLGSPISVGICDDTSIVNVEDGKEALLLTGLKVGRTQCGFWKPTESTTHTVIEVVVTADDPDAKPTK